MPYGQVKHRSRTAPLPARFHVEPKRRKKSPAQGLSRSLSSSFSSSSSLDALESTWNPPKPVAPGQINHYHLRVQNMQITPPAACSKECKNKPVAKDPVADPNTWWGWLKVQSDKLQPGLGYLGQGIAFLIGRVGVGLNVSPLFFRI